METRVTQADLQPTLPADRAFVVQFRAVEAEATTVAVGRAEHLVTGTTTHFVTWHELQDFVESVLAAESVEKSKNF
jgi:hypothetical protein